MRVQLLDIWEPNHQPVCISRCNAARKRRATRGWARNLTATQLWRERRKERLKTRKRKKCFLAQITKVSTLKEDGFMML